MSDSPIRQDSHSESSVSSAAVMRVAPDSRASSLTHDCMGHEVVSLIDYSDSKRLCGNSLIEIASSLNSFKAFLSDDSGEEDHTEDPMPLPVVIDTEIQVAKLMRERVIVNLMIMKL